MKNIDIDYWSGEKHERKKYVADVSFYPHGSFGYCYRGNIYNNRGDAIGDYATNEFAEIKKNFIIEGDD